MSRTGFGSASTCCPLPTLLRSRPLPDPRMRSHEDTKARKRKAKDEFRLRDSRFVAFVLSWHSMSGFGFPRRLDSAARLAETEG